jgi:hypothetical protein
MTHNDARLAELLAELKAYFGDVPSARRHFAQAEAAGLHVTPVHFYSPIPDVSRLEPEIFERDSELPGVDMDEAGQLRLLEEVFARHTEDFRGFPLKSRGNDLEFSFDNDQISGADPFTIYALTRHLRPKRIVEVGSGYSTLVTSRAVRENGSGSILCVEPYPRAFLERAVEGVGEVRRQPVQDTPLEVFEELGAGDILFIDSTHTVRIGGDVNRLFLEILPRLKPGVWVHVHDIFLPHDYPRQWIEEMRFFWAEQYLLQAFLCFNRAFRVRFAVGYMGRRHLDRMRAVFPGYQLGMGGGSFWMERVAV